jgi:hypothetical protein
MINPQKEVPTLYIAPNPMALDSIFSAVLTSFSGVLTRSIGTAGLDQEQSSADANCMVNFYRLARFTLELQDRHWSLFVETEGSKKPLKPIGVEGLHWSSSKQIEEYKIIRDQALDLFIRVTIETIQAPRFILTSENDQIIQHALDTIQHSLYQYQNSETYADSSSSLALGLKTAASTLEALHEGMLPSGSE